MQISRVVYYTLPALIAIIGLARCNYIKPKGDTPPPNDQVVEKSFFTDSSGNSKTFLCGWAAESNVGAYGYAAAENGVSVPGHCNMTFEVQEDKLIGRLVNPSYPNDQSRWKIVMTIPIKGQFYVEKEKDSRGRDTENTKRNSSRSHWSARPNMELDFAGLDISEWAYQFTSTGKFRTLYVDDVEWDKQKNFLGFTLHAEDAYLGALQQVAMRFNFLEFKHNDNFQMVPFNDKNYRYLNILHVIGEKDQGIYQILHAAHWDLEHKDPEFYLYNAPEKYVSLVQEVFDKWNTALRKIGAIPAGRKGFVLNTTVHPAHGFDLRYPAIYWIQDPDISTNSALGIGMTEADVRNGEILWGSTTIYSGIIEKYIRSYVPNQAGGTVANSTDSGSASRVSLKQGIFKENVLNKLAFPKELQEFNLNNRYQTAQNLTKFSLNSVNKSILEQAQKEFGAQLERSGKSTEEKARLMQDFVSQSQDKILSESAVGTILTRLGQLTEQKIAQTNQSSVATQYLETLQNIVAKPSENAAAQAATNQNSLKLNEAKLIALQNRAYNASGSSIACADRTIKEMIPMWTAGIKDKPIEEYIKVVVEDLVIHEMGHVIGLGHQFKENIMPEKGTVPDGIFNELNKVANEKSGYINRTSVMGYSHPWTNMAMTLNDVQPGAHDLLALRYLYRSQYSTFKKGDADFTYFPIPASGIIPPQGGADGKFETRYFPQCNDYDASVSVDPYCNRHDRGSNAKEIVGYYLAEIENSLTYSLMAFTDNRNIDAESAEGNMWYRSLDRVGRIRIFYDYMRRKYKNQIDQIRTNEDALYEFSKACQQDGKSQIEVLNRIFDSSPEFKELCQVNAKAIEKLGTFASLKGSDYTRYDYNNRFAPGGMRGGDVTSENDSALVGTWTELSALPLKLTALYGMTSPTPWVILGGMYSIPGYNGPDQKYSYSSLYPKEYTQAISAVMRSGLQLANLDNSENSIIGHSLLSLGYFNYLSNLSNDGTRFPDRFLNHIRNQTRFNLSYAAILLTPVAKDNNSQRIDKFNVKILDMRTEKEQEAGVAYLLEDGSVIVRAENTFLYAFDTIHFANDSLLYTFAYKLDYVTDQQEELSNSGMKTVVKALYEQVIDSCINGPRGEQTGLAQFFNKNEKLFDGFFIQKGIADNQNKQRQFFDSIKTAFDTYYKKAKYNDRSPSPQVCAQALTDLKVIFSGAAISNGYWLPEVQDRIEK